MVGEDGFASRALKNSPPDCFLLTAVRRAVLISSSFVATNQKSTDLSVVLSRFGGRGWIRRMRAAG